MSSPSDGDQLDGTGVWTGCYRRRENPSRGRPGCSASVDRPPHGIEIGDAGTVDAIHPSAGTAVVGNPLIGGPVNMDYRMGAGEGQPPNSVAESGPMAAKTWVRQATWYASIPPSDMPVAYTRFGSMGSSLPTEETSCVIKPTSSTSVRAGVPQQPPPTDQE